MILRADSTLPITDICKTLGVSKATFYRYTAPGETAASGKASKQEDGGRHKGAEYV